MLIWFAVIIVTVFLDQLTKYYTVLHLKPIDTYPIIEDVLHLTYVENTGAAFGMMKDARWVFMVTSTLAIIGILGYMIWRTYIKKEKLHWMEALSLSFIVGGGIGNMIDRTALGYVVDMIDCRFINFAVFNVADSFVCVGAGLMILYLVVLTAQDYKDSKAIRCAEVSDTGSEDADGTAVDGNSAEDPFAEDTSVDGTFAEDTFTEEEGIAAEDTAADGVADHGSAEVSDDE